MNRYLTIGTEETTETPKRGRGRPKGSKNKPKNVAAPQESQQIPAEAPVPVVANFSRFDLNDRIYNLLSEEPFFGAVSRYIDKVPTFSIPTAAVTITPDGYFQLLYNPTSMGGLSKQHQIGILMHEFYHILLGHLTTRRTESNLMEKWNYATDLAINCSIADRLPTWTLLPGRGNFANLPVDMAAEWYMTKLPENPGGGGRGDNGKPGQGQGDPQGTGKIDDHSSWNNISDEARGIAEERSKDILSKAANEVAGGRGWGSVSADMRSTILKRIETRVDWKKVLRMFVGSVVRGEKKKTIKRINKRYPFIHAGSKVLRHAKIGIAIDQSGSVGDELLSKFFSELDKLAEIATFVVIPFDTRVDDNLVYEWKKGERRKAERVMCGGTCFDAPTRWANEHTLDGLIIMTDMGAPKPERCKCPRMWMCTNNDKEFAPFQTNERIVIVD
jgi:predicted metal-dependent peptidase